jgi:hypothetical protein
MSTKLPSDEIENSFVITLKANDSRLPRNDLESFDFDVEKCPTRNGQKPKLLTRYMELLAGLFLEC